MRYLFVAFIFFSAATSLCGQTETNLFAKHGLKKVMMATSSKGEFEEFHYNKEVVEISSILYNTKTKEVIGYIDESIENDVTSATPAMSIDPNCEKYYWISPYVYCLNNPVRFIDPDGRDVIISGDKDFQKRTFEDLQKLTSSSLVMLKNGKVIESSNYNEKKHGIALFSGEGSGNKELGTTVVSELIGSKHIISIKKGSENNFGNYTTDAFKQIGKDGKGSGGNIQYNYTNSGSNIVNTDKTTGHPAHIGLSHELIHGWHAVKGQIMSIKPGFKSDPDRTGPGLIDVSGISAEEYNTRIQENTIRKEQSVKLRAIPK